MEPAKRQKLEAAEWKVTTVAELLDLSPEEMEMIEIRLSLSKLLKKFKKKQELPQQKLVGDINFSRSQVTKIEARDTNGSIDLLIKSLLSLGATREDIATAISGK